MGMPLTKYSLLKAIGYGSDRYVNAKAEELFSKYKLVGLILHDPQEHKSFHLAIERLFDKLDYLTGNLFLFLTLVNPPAIGNHKKFSHFWEEQFLLNPANAYFTDDDSISAFTIASLLGISYDDLPCIVLTQDLKCSDFIFIRTSSEFVENQLKEIGYFCSRFAGQKISFNDNSLKTLIQNINYLNNSNLKHLDKNLAKTLADFLLVVAKEDNSVNDFKYRYINSLMSQVRQEKQKHPIENQDLFENNLLSLLGMLSHLEVKQDDFDLLSRNEIYNESTSIKKFKLVPLKKINLRSHSKKTSRKPAAEKEQMPDIPDRQKLENLNSHELKACYCKTISEDISPALYEHLQSTDVYFDSLSKYDFEAESKIMLKTSKKVLNLLSEENYDEVDYTPVVIALGKLFEKETNLSLVHWIRKKLHIELPDYFNMVKPEGRYFYTPSTSVCKHPLPIDFNMGLNKWIPPKMWDSEMAVTSFYNDKKYIETFNNERTKVLLEEWSVIRRIRNQAAHDCIVNADQLKTIIDSYKKLEESQILIRMMKLKRKYRGKHSANPNLN